jgi:hypothetical protein
LKLWAIPHKKNKLVIKTKGRTNFTFAGIAVGLNKCNKFFYK